uniref:Huntingtin-like n=1 Tax=Diabrotica virgifera virgifera TaxID=50390 RepID=A0A6P7F8J4_DIAVI
MATQEKLQKSLEALKNLSKYNQNPSDNSKKKEKIQYCYNITDAISNSTIRVSTNFHSLLGTSIEVFLLLCDDEDADIRMTSEECLNRIIRAANGSIGKIQIELHKEIKRNGPARSLRTALWLFSLLAHRIRPHKGKPYVANMFPGLIKITERNEEAVHETLAASLPNIMKVLGCFTIENEIKALLKAFLSNISSESTVIRRTTTSCVLTVCMNCKNPYVFMTYCLNNLLDTIIPVNAEHSTFQILGIISCIKSLIQNIFSVETDSSLQNKNALTEKLLQIFELCLHYLSHKDHNIINICLETLKVLLECPCSHFRERLNSGFGCHRIYSSEKLCILSNRSPSQLSVATTVTTEDNLFSDSDLTETLHSDIEKWIDETSISVRNITFAKTKEKSQSLDKISRFELETIRNIDVNNFGGLNQLNKENFITQRKAHSIENTLDILSFSENSSEKSYCGVDSEEKLLNLEVCIQEIEAGNLLDATTPLIYCIRLITKLFLLNGIPENYISDKVVRVSVKYLAISCLSSLFNLYPKGLFMYLDKNYSQNIKSKRISSQKLSDILLLRNHVDPQLRGAIRNLLGNYLKVVSHLCEGGYEDWIGDNCIGDQDNSVQICDIVNIFIQGLNDESSNCIRQTLVTLKNNLKYLIESHQSNAVIPLLNTLPALSENPYWLVKVSLCELVSKIDYINIYYVTENNDFQEKVLYNVLFNLLSDSDQRVRTSAASSIVQIIPHLYYGEYLLNEGTPTSKALLDIAALTKNLKHEELDTSVNKKHFISNMPFPFNKISQKICDKTDFSLSKVVSRLCNIVLTTVSKNLLSGCIETLSLLSNAYPCTLYKSSWSTMDFQVNNDLKMPDLLNFCLSLLTNSVHVYSLQTHMDILNLSVNLYAGHALTTLKPVDLEITITPWVMFNNEVFSDLSDQYLYHIIKLLNIFQHVLNDLQPLHPQAKPVLPNLPATANLSPLKRRKSDLDKKSMTLKLEKDEKNDRKDIKSFFGLFVQSGHYMKIYESVRSSFSNYKVSLDSASSKTFLEFLSSTLRSLSVLLEVGSLTEFGKLAEEILGYFRSTFVVDPSGTIQAVQQLLKCLFGTNLTANILEFPLQKSETKEFDKGFYQNIFQKPYSLVSWYIQSLNNIGRHDLDDDNTVMGYLHRRDTKRRSVILTRTSDKTLANYIRIFEPMVIKSLKQYTMTSSVKLQCQVLKLLSQLVQLRVNYCLLDSEQVFIGFVLKQFEYIEEGQVPAVEELIPKIFQFLVQLSYSKQHSKLIIGVPKIIQLCDGLMASGQPAATHCIPALQPIVEDIFLTRNKSNTPDFKELETTREVILSMLLRLCDNKQVLDLITLILEDSKYCTHNTEKWYEWSKRVFHVVLPMLKQNKLKLDDPESLAAMRRFILAMNPEVFKPFDEIIVMFFQDPPSLDTNLTTFYNWFSKILILLLLIIPLKEEALLVKINKLKAEFPPAIIFENVTPKADPLNVYNNAETFQNISAEIILIRYLFRILNLVSKRCVMAIKRQEKGFIFEQLFGFLLHCLYMFQSGGHPKVTKIAATVLNSNIPFDEENFVEMKSINDNFLTLAVFYPILGSQWCNFLILLNYNDRIFWQRAFQSNELENNLRVKNPILNLEVMKYGSTISFCDFLSENIPDINNITWFLDRNSSLLIDLHHEPPVSEFLTFVHRSAQLSQRFIYNIYEAVKQSRSSVFKVRTLKCIENCHQSQIGTVLNLLIPHMLKFHQAAVSRRASNIANRKIEELLTLSMEEVSNQLSKEELVKMQRDLVNCNLVKKNETLVSLLNKLSVQFYDLSPIEFEQRRVVNPEYIKKLKIDRKWYLTQIQNKYKDSNIGREMAELLSKLEYNEIVSFMSSSGFNKHNLKDCLRLGLMEVDKLKTNDSCDLLRASIDCLLKDISSVVCKIPEPHQVYSPIERIPSASESLYTKQMTELFDNQEFSSLLYSLAMSIPLFSKHILANSSYELSNNNLEDLAKFSVLCLEYMRFLESENVDFRVHLTDICLTCCDTILRNISTCNFLELDSNATWLCSSINSVYSLVNTLLRSDRPLLTVPKYNLKGNESSTAMVQATHELYTLTCWLFELKMYNTTKIPDFLFNRIKSLTFCLARLPLVNSYALIPQRAWKTGWQPDTMDGTFGTVVAALPIDMLQDIEVLQEYIFRINLLGWTSRQQFEETWMCLLSVLCAPTEELEPLVLNDVLHASTLAIKSITTLLLQTLALPVVGNPNISEILHIPRNSNISECSIGVQKLKRIQKCIQTSYNNSSHVSDDYKIVNVFNLRNLEKSSDRYSCGQVSVRYLLVATGSVEETQDNIMVAEICRQRTQKLESMGLDVNSCLQFLIDYYTQLMRPQSHTHIRVLHEAVRSTIMISDLFTDKSQFSWMMEVFLELFKIHHSEDEFLYQYLILGICKAAAVLSPDLETFDNLKKMLVQYLKSPYLTSRISSLYGILYLLEGCKLKNINIGAVSEELQLILPCAVEYVQFNLNPSNNVLKKSQEHTSLVWSLAFYLVENVEEIHMEQSFVTNVMTTAFTTLQGRVATWLHTIIIKGLERLLIIKKSLIIEQFGKQFLKLALNKMKSDNPTVAILGTQFLLSYLYTDCVNYLQSVQTSSNTPTNPDSLVQTIEMVSAIFERIKRGYVYEVEILCSVMPKVLDDFFSPADILTKVIGEFLSAQQPHPKLLSKVVFQVFQSAIQRNQLSLLQDWVVFSLSNFTQSFSIGMATWCLTCFFVSATTNDWLRSYFSYIQTRVGRYEYEDRKMLCIAGADFYKNLTNAKQRQTFIDNFTKVKDQVDTPFNDLLLSL